MKSISQGQVLAGPAFLLVATMDGATRPGYDPLRHPISALSFGSRGPLQRLNFVVLGISYLRLSRQLAREEECEPLVPWIVATAGLGLIVTGAAQADPISGYPPGTPPEPSEPTQHGWIHDLGAVPVFFGIPAAALISAASGVRHRDLRWAGASAAAAGTAIAGARLSIAAFEQDPRLVRWGGLIQRVAAGCCLGWVSARAARRPRA